MEPINVDKLSISQCYNIIDEAERRIRDNEKFIFLAEEEIRRLQNGTKYNFTQESIDNWHRQIFERKAASNAFQSDIRRIQNKIQQLAYLKK
ncbi:MAG: hypothetical protein FWD60_07665 [Candidatus Azobacteroides sp.]|nr:hypothetical protein [Candidatus Azobacteroides sp.]